MCLLRRKAVLSMMGVFAACILMLTAALFNLTVLQGTGYAQTGESNTTRTLTITAKRGSILDASGYPMAYDKTSYNITFSRDPMHTGQKWRTIYTDIILKTIRILEKNGNEVIDTLSIRRNGEGSYYFYWGANHR